MENDFIFNQVLMQQQKSRAFYRIQATRMMIGAGNILKKHAADQARKVRSVHFLIWQFKLLDNISLERVCFLCCCLFSGGEQQWDSDPGGRPLHRQGGVWALFVPVLRKLRLPESDCSQTRRRPWSYCQSEFLIEQLNPSPLGYKRLWGWA